MYRKTVIIIQRCCVHWCSVVYLIFWEIICVFPVYPHIIMKITLSNRCLWLRTHNSAKEKVWLHLFSVFQHMNLNEPVGENNYSLIQCWNPYQMCKARMSRSHGQLQLIVLSFPLYGSSIVHISLNLMLIHCERDTL